MWQVRRWAVVLTAIVAVYTVTAVLLMRTTADGPVETTSDRVAESNEAARPMPEAVAVAAVPELVAVVATVSSTADAPKTREIVAPLESRREAVPPVRPERPKQRVSVSSPEPVEPAPVLESRVAPLLASPPLPSGLPVDPRPVVEVPATPPRSEASVAPVPRLPPPEAAIQTVLTRYRTAYRDLDAGAARAVWPSVDARALRKAFDRLEQQELIFDSCGIAVSGIRAVASCQGVARYVPRVGNKGPHDDRRLWEFTLNRVDDVWQIETVSAR